MWRFIHWCCMAIVSLVLNSDSLQERLHDLEAHIVVNCYTHTMLPGSDATTTCMSLICVVVMTTGTELLRVVCNHGGCTCRRTSRSVWFRTSALRELTVRSSTILTHHQWRYPHSLSSRWRTLLIGNVARPPNKPTNQNAHIISSWAGYYQPKIVSFS